MNDQIDKLMKEDSELSDILSNYEERLNYLRSSVDKIKSSKAWIVYNKLLSLVNSRDIILNNTKKLIPIKVRKHILGLLTKFTRPVNKIPLDIRNEWIDYNRKRKPEKLDILIFSIIAFDYRIQRPQHLAIELAKKGHRIFYIENEFTPIVKHSTYDPIKVEKKADNLYIVKLSASRNLFIYSDKITKRDREIIKASYRNLILKANIINPIAKIDHPFWSQILDEIAMPVVYDCMDEHSGFADTGSNLEDLEKDLFKISDLVLVSSDYLDRKVRKNKYRKMLVLKNAGDFEHFSKAKYRFTKEPDELKNLKRPILGYYGALAEWFDNDIIESLAQKYFDASIVLLGRVSNNGLEKLADKYKNIYLLGEKSYEDLPAYLQEFDVCLIPFIINNLIRATSPVKIFEYLAAGKPVVSTNIPELKYYRDQVYISEGNEEFLNNVSNALKERDKSIAERQNIARKNTWIERGKRLEKSIKEIIYPKISVIILTYNNALVTKECIDSLFNRSFYPNFETIIVDNASNDETLSELHRLQIKYKFRLIQNKSNLGFAAGNNIGMKYAKGKYLILLNNDTKITPGWISRLLYHIKKDKVGLVGPVTNRIGNEAKIYISYNPLNNNSIEKAALEYTSVHWGQSFNLEKIAAFCWIMSKKIYKKIGGFDERFGKALFEDDDYCLRVKKGGYNILVSDDVFIHHWGGITSKWKSPEYQKLLEENKKKFENKWKMKWVPHKIRRNGFIEIIKYKLAGFNYEKNTSVFKR